jgi:hypothetical protein
MKSKTESLTSAERDAGSLLGEEAVLALYDRHFKSGPYKRVSMRSRYESCRALQRIEDCASIRSAETPTSSKLKILRISATNRSRSRAHSGGRPQSPHG